MEPENLTKSVFTELKVDLTQKLKQEKIQKLSAEEIFEKEYSFYPDLKTSLIIAIKQILQLKRLYKKRGAQIIKCLRLIQKFYDNQQQLILQSNTQVMEKQDLQTLIKSLKRKLTLLENELMALKQLHKNCQKSQKKPFQLQKESENVDDEQYYQDFILEEEDEHHDMEKRQDSPAKRAVSRKIGQKD